MSSFNTSTNTGSTTFTNAYGTVDLLPSAIAQYAYGFARTSGWRYWEASIDDEGADASRVLVGMQYSPLTATEGYVYGGNSKTALFQSGALNPVHPFNASIGSLTARTGDVFMFAVDMTGAGRDYSGTPQLATISSGTGTLLSPIYISVGKNGVWGADSLIGWSWPAGGFPMRSMPMIVRDSTSAAYARVSLRVATTSFAYAIPAGMVAWGDGPEGGIHSATDVSVYWDPAHKDSEITLSDNNRLAISTAAGSSFSNFSVLSTQLIASGKRVVEFWGAGKAYGASLSAVTPGTDTRYHFGLVETDFTSLSWAGATGGGSSNKLIWTDDRWRRGVNVSASATNVAVVSSIVGPQQNGSIFYIDFDSERLWQRRGLGRANGAPSFWSGRTISTSEGPNPFIGNDGSTFSAQSSDVRMIAWDRKDLGTPSWVYINGGQQNFQTFPLLPGWRSMNGQLEVAGVGSVWDTSVMPTSCSTCFTGLGMRTKRAPRVISRSTQKKSTGKWFFEIFSDSGNGGASLSTVVGLIPDTVSTFEHTNVTSIVATGLWWSPGGNDRFRDGVTLSASNSVTWTSVGVISSTNVWWACAVDFDAGQVWFGSWNWNRQAIAWAVGANPVTGTQPDMTFTACTTMHIACVMPNASGWNYLVAETNNVIGKPDGFIPWNGDSYSSLTATPSGSVSPTASSALRVLWPYGVQT